MILALFLLELAAGLIIFLPLVGRRTAGVKFYRLVIVTALALVAVAAFSHLVAGARSLALLDFVTGGLHVLTLLLLRYPKRLTFRISAAALGLALIATTLVGYEAAIGPASVWWTAAGAVTSMLLVGSVTLAMLLGHWYLVVRGMPIDPLMRLTRAYLAATAAKSIVLAAAALSLGTTVTRGTPLYQLIVTEGIFFWMRVGWGLVALFALFPMVHGTVKIRSTMAATGILYVAVVAAIIGEVLGTYLSAMFRLPL